MVHIRLSFVHLVLIKSSLQWGEGVDTGAGRLSLKSQMANILGFVSCVAEVTSIRLRCCETKQPETVGTKGMAVRQSSFIYKNKPQTGFFL